ncbi:helix-turn-helix domain-containing protein [Microaerobacter geothermalis]|nr:helix-turn-helix domain-containing protein [Microaerobacter geothermalis]
MRLTLPAKFSLIVFSLASFSSDQEIDQFRNLIRSFSTYTSKTTHWIENREQIVVIIDSPSLIEGSSQTLANEFVNQIFEQMEKKKLILPYVGIGNEYTNILMAGKSYTEALEVINIVSMLKPELSRRLIEYSKLGIYRLLTTIHEKNKNDNYFNESLIKIMEYDRENQSELLQTLEVYLVNNCKLKETAERLYVHPNTLNYRIKRIMEIAKIDFDDFHTRCQLYIDLLILRYLK